MKSSARIPDRSGLMMGSLTIRVITDSKEFESLRETWDGLLEKSYDNNIYLTWEWLFTWWKHYGEGKKLSILLIEDEGRIIGIAPLMQSRYRKGFIKFDVLENICSTNCDYSGIILTQRKEEAMTTLLAYLGRIISSSNIILRISQILKDSEFLSLLRKQHPPFAKSLILNERVLTTCPYMSLPATWDEYFYSLRRKRRGNLSRALKSLQKDHTVEFEKCAPSNNLRESMQIFFDLHQKRWREQGISGIFAEQKEREFYTDVAGSFSEKGWLDLTFINVDTKAASAVFGLKYERKFYYMVTAFASEYTNHSLGNLHIMYLIEDAIKNGLKEFDFLKGDEVYKLYWARLARENMQVVLMSRKFAASGWIRLFYTFMRLDEICKRSLLENYRLYRNMKRAQKVIRKMKKGEA